MTAIIDSERIEEVKLYKAIQSIQKMSARKRIRNKEWGAFFGQAGMIEIISREKFLRELGDCFTTKSVNDNLYRTLMNQLDRVEDYLQSRKIDLTNSVGSDPLNYARSKIERAHAAYLTNQDVHKHMLLDMLLQSIRSICRIFIRL